MTLIVDQVSKTYGKKAVLTDVSFAVEEGSVVGLLGPNGSGKSSTLHVIAGLTKPSAGSVFIDSRSGQKRHLHAIGFCPDDLPQPELLTAQEYLDLMQGIRGIRVSDDIIWMLLSGFRLQDHRDELIGSFSHGMKRKLQVVGALLHLPSILILDEPFRGLDPESSAIMHQLITGYVDHGNAVLISTHDLALAERLCNRVVVLEGGRVLHSGTTPEVVAVHGRKTLEESFLTLTGLDMVVEDSVGLFFEGLGELRSAHLREAS
ncbi:ABC transporter ATP-binding protein [Microbacterium sp. X-17]|uniref:ABC transporter ATP-binding protein n=1 Tax=Microbacterium sp. X-17 TaxID=3144404 RepID=UPI0031F5717D